MMACHEMEPLYPGKPNSFAACGVAKRKDGSGMSQVATSNT
jgi:hypothetical protein